MRINCAHDSKAEWECMVKHAHRANQELRKHCKVLMDLAGPKLRTGTIRKGHRVLRWRISRDALGAVITPARIALVGREAGRVYDPVNARLPVPESFLRVLRVGDNVRLIDCRGRKRVLNVVHKSQHACLCTCERGAYVVSRANLSVRRNGTVAARAHVGTLPFVEEPITLQAGSRLLLTKEENLPRRHPLPAFPASVALCWTCLSTQKLDIRSSSTTVRSKVKFKRCIRITLLLKLPTQTPALPNSVRKGHQLTADESRNRRDHRERPSGFGFRGRSRRHRWAVLCPPP